MNLGVGDDVHIRELADMVKKVVGFEGEIVWDTSKPDGAPQKLLDISKIHAFGWKHKIELVEGIEKTYDWFKNNSLNLK